MKVLYLPTNIASLMSANIDGLKKEKINGVGFVFAPSPIQSSENVFIRPLNGSFLANIRFYFSFIYNLFTCTHIHWLYGSKSRMGNLLLFFVAILKRRKFIEFVGSDIRSLEKMCSDIEGCNIEDFDKNTQFLLGTEASSRKNQIKFKLLGFKAIVNSIELCDYVKSDIFPKFFLYNRSINLENFNFYPQSSVNKIPLVLHIPSNTKLKGTQTFEEAAIKLKKEKIIDFKLLTGVPHQEALKELANADIVVDQLVIGEYGVLSIEAMALGKPTICFIRPKLEEQYKKDFQGFPLINANTKNIYEVLKNVAQNLDYFKNIGHQGPKFVKEYHSIESNVKKLLEIYNS